MSYVFTIDLRELNDQQLVVLRELGCEVHVPSHRLDDEQYVRLQWLLKYRERLELDRPRTFSEKLQWLKLRYRDVRMPGLVDKLAVREFVAGRVGAEHLNTLYASANEPRELDRASLPDELMLKCTHGSGWNVAIMDRSPASWAAAVERVERWLTINYYDLRREWVYRTIPPRVVVERLLHAPGPGLVDYKLFCFNGRARVIQVDLDRHGAHRRNLYDERWRRIPCELRYPGGYDVPRPATLPSMLALAEALALGFPFVRVDLYEIDGHVLFGELTFFPGNGFEAFAPASHDRELGDMLELPTGGGASVG
ncbi:ATP-grasp fold amidoligase family protein [Sorangium sp. So ce426]|uniref:ATP-grasp fold amidoligase family protein n=1 Tax=Sorangium sp. So ce426 TaxID=3133312 RepID=UPI003F5B7395